VLVACCWLLVFEKMNIMDIFQGESDK